MLEIGPETQFDVWGVVTYIIHKAGLTMARIFALVDCNSF